MNVFLNLTQRNIKLYLRDKSAVFFSLLSSIIVILLFILFLGDMYINQIVESFGEVDDIFKNNVNAMIMGWVFGGMIVLNSLSVPQIMLSRIILDRENKKLNDLYVTPINRKYLVFSYIASAVITATITTFITFLIGEVYLFTLTKELFNIMVHLKVLAVIILLTSSFSSLMFLVYLFVKNSSAIGGITAFISSIGGFLGGIYISIGGMSGFIKDVISLNPLAHGATILRKIIMEDYINKVYESAPQNIKKEFLDGMGINLYVGNTEIPIYILFLTIVLTGIISLILSYIKLSKDKL